MWHGRMTWADTVPMVLPLQKSVVNVVSATTSLLKYNTTEPILESLYAEELDKEKRAKIAELKKTDPKAELQNAILTTLTMATEWIVMPWVPRWVAGVAALMAGDTIIYPIAIAIGKSFDKWSAAFQR